MAPTVQAIVAHGAHDLRVDEVSPQSCGDSEVLVEIAVGGICGSDLHYFSEGAVGDFAIREPLILGHEIAGRVVSVGARVTDVTEGVRVAIDPSFPCGVCAVCRSGRRNLCREGRFLGSAARMPHSQGGFRDQLVIDASQCVALPDDLPFEAAVFAEPLSVAIHAVGRAGPLFNRDVLITGAGPIGLLTLVAAIRAGAATVSITDVLPAPLAVAQQLGATATIDASTGASLPTVDVAIEASGATAAVVDCVNAVRPAGRVVLVGLLPRGASPVPANLAVAQELEITGSFRFTSDEFKAAVAALGGGLDVSAMLSARIPAANAMEAFELALRRDKALKVQLVFSDEARVGR